MPPSAGTPQHRSLHLLHVCTAESTLLLKEGEWPVTAEQSACMARAAEASLDFTIFFGMAQLLSTAMFYGPGNETDAVLLTDGIQDLLPLSVGQATRSFEALAKHTLLACGLPEPRLEGQAADDPGGAARCNCGCGCGCGCGFGSGCLRKHLPPA